MNSSIKFKISKKMIGDLGSLIYHYSLLPQRRAIEQSVEKLLVYSKPTSPYSQIT